jgi:hypothetical protein
MSKQVGCEVVGRFEFPGVVSSRVEPFFRRSEGSPCTQSRYVGDPWARW